MDTKNKKEPSALQRLHAARRDPVFVRFIEKLSKEPSLALHSAGPEERQLWTALAERLFDAVYDYKDIFQHRPKHSHDRREHAFKKKQYSVLVEMRRLGLCQDPQIEIAKLVALARIEVEHITATPEQREKVQSRVKKERKNGDQVEADAPRETRGGYELLNQGEEVFQRDKILRKKYSGLLSNFYAYGSEVWDKHQASDVLGALIDQYNESVPEDRYLRLHDVLVAVNEALGGEYDEMVPMYPRLADTRPADQVREFLRSDTTNDVAVNSFLLNLLDREIVPQMIESVEALNPKGNRYGPDFIEEVQAEFQRRMAQFQVQLAVVANNHLSSEDSKIEFGDDCANLMAAACDAMDHFLDPPKTERKSGRGK